jgi:uncharacterized protein (DUF1499 family)
VPRFDACPEGSKKCVSTLNTAGYSALDPVAYAGDPAAALAAVEAVVGSFPRTRVIERDDTYLRTTFTTKWLRFTDTVEFELDTAAGVVHFRSESVPYAGSDLGANRKRMKAVSEQLRSRLG